MTSPISTGSYFAEKTIPSVKVRSFHLEESSSSLSSLGKNSSPSYLRRFISYVFSPLTRFINWIIDKIAPTDQEIELIQDLKNDVKGALVFLSDHSEGEAQLQKVLAACDNLYQKLEKKWFSNNDRAIFFRGSLLVIKLGAYIILGDRAKVNECLANLDSHGVDLGIENEQFLAFILSHTERSEINLEKIALLNLCVKIGIKVDRKYEKSKAENQKIKTFSIVAKRVLAQIEKRPDNLEEIETLHKLTKFALKYEKTYLGWGTIKIGKMSLWFFKKFI